MILKKQYMIFQSPLVLDQLKINLGEQSPFYIDTYKNNVYEK